jgi:type I restriction enzyme S subunit
MTTNLQTYSKYKNSSIGWLDEIPSEWGEDKIVSLFNFPNDKVSDKDFEPLSVTYDGVKKQVEDAAKTDNDSNRKLLKIGDIAFNGRSDRRGACGVSNYTGSISVVYHVLRKTSSNVHVRYYHHLFRNTLFSQEFYRWGRGIHDDIWTTRTIEMKRIQVPVPPLETQQRIADFLDEKTKIIDELVAKKEKLIELLKEKRTAVINRAIIKASGKPSKIKSCIILNPNKRSHLALKEECVSFVPMEALSENGVLKLQQKQYSEVKEGFTYFEDNDVVLAKITPCYENGKAGVMRGLLNNFGFGTTEFIVLRPNNKILPEYLYLLIFSDRFRKIGEVEMRGTAGQKRVTNSYVRNYEFTLPTIDNQHKIIEFINISSNTIIEAVEKINFQIEKLKEYRSSLIYSAVTGKIKV